MFTNRTEVGAKLAHGLLQYTERDPVVIAVPGGGVPVGLTVSRALGAPLDVLIVGKLHAPGQPDVSVGAITEGEEPSVVLSPAAVRATDLPQEFLSREKRRRRDEIGRKNGRYRKTRTPIPVGGRTVVLVDDGLVTGTTARAAIQQLRHRGADWVVLAIGAAPPDVVDDLLPTVDHLVCLTMPWPFGALSDHYESFDPVTDREIARLLDERAREVAPSGGRPTASGAGSAAGR